MFILTALSPTEGGRETAVMLKGPWGGRGGPARWIDCAETPLSQKRSGH